VVGVTLNAKLCGVILVFQFIILTQLLITPVQAAIYVPPTGVCTINIENIDATSKTLRVNLVMEDPTWPPVFPDRSTSELVVRYEGYPYSYIIKADDFDWQLVGTNGIGSHWKLEREFVLPYTSDSFYPYEQFNVTFYFATNMTHNFNVNPMSNYKATIDKQQITINQFPPLDSQHLFGGTAYDNLTAQQLFDTNKITIVMNSQDVVTEAASMIYGLFVVLVAVALLLIVLFWKSILSFSSSVGIAITTTILFFLPILLLTFRTSIAPNYPTFIDLLSLALMAVYGVLLCIQLGGKIYQVWKSKKKTISEVFDY
jgi:hypothetical protein